MNRVLVIARREWLEQLRQPFMLVVIATLFAIVGLLVVLVMLLLNDLAADPEGAENLEILRGRGVLVVDPDEGFLACGDYGKGRLASTDSILAAVRAALGPGSES